MPKSKREKVVHLTQTTKKGKKLKEKLVNDLRDCCDQYSHIFVFSCENMRNTSFKEVRAEWEGSRFFMGKNKVMALALGTSEAGEYKQNLSQLTPAIRGNRGLLFTNTPEEDVQSWFAKYSVPHYARSGFKATASFRLDAGPLDLPFNMEPQLRKLGLSTKLDNGVIMLLTDLTVCSPGQILTPEQCKILELFEQPQAVFRMHVHCLWHADTVTSYEEGAAAAPDGEMKDDN
eukprot:CAMPEP_0205822234 /NCGR_PEP_ID=MMETSP0206-20130828/11686_1 /ASSEMBLY_ACC=CAM_ASM_000279 /TAXON_ID=36767 /ORGANISM="Euplotes focardii, Strain TN1" /LENGTH=231 /DNA_ID=CAMNT_0053118341 /DNA_START=35 /DNA_END=730 /DNA_ORIENTATION=+